jgi:hypothetical protein
LCDDDDDDDNDDDNESSLSADSLIATYKIITNRQKNMYRQTETNRTQ